MFWDKMYEMELDKSSYIFNLLMRCKVETTTDPDKHPIHHSPLCGLSRSTPTSLNPSLVSLAERNGLIYAKGN